MLCPQGSKFHLDFYNECLQSFENVIQAAKLNPQNWWIKVGAYRILSTFYL